MSQISSSSNFQSQETSRIVVPIVKFSCSLTPYGSSMKGPQWTHHLRNDLELIIQKAQGSSWQGQSDDRVLLKVVAGAEFLEEQDLRDISRIARDFRPLPGVEVPVRVVVKPPLLALRYPKPSHDIRRIQVRFREDADFARVLNTLKDLGLAITDGAPSAASFSQSYPTPTNDLARSSVPPSDNAARPLSSSNSMAPNPEQAATSSQVSTDFKVPVRPNTANSVPYKSSSSPAPSRYLTPSSRPQSATSISNFMSQSKPSVETLKKSQSLYVSQLERDSASTKVKELNNTTPSSERLALRNQSFDNQPPIREQEPILSVSPFFSDQPQLPPSTSFKDSSTSHVSQSQNEKARTMQPNYDMLSLERRPISLPNERDTYFNLPPMRELPFLKPKEPAKARSFSTAERSSVATSTPVSRKRSYDDSAHYEDAEQNQTPPSARLPTKRQVANRQGKISANEDVILPPKHQPLPKKTTSHAAKSPIQEEQSSPLAAKSAAASSASNSSKSSKLQSKATVTKQRSAVVNMEQNAKRQTMVDKATQTQTLSGRDHTAAIRSAPVTSTTDASTNTSQSAPPIFQKDLDLFASMHGRSSRIDLPPNYSEVAHEARDKMLNEFICDNLENEHFLKLAEDMSVSWRRLGLGR